MGLAGAGVAAWVNGSWVSGTSGQFTVVKAKKEIGEEHSVVIFYVPYSRDLGSLNTSPGFLVVSCQH